MRPFAQPDVFPQLPKTKWTLLVSNLCAACFQNHFSSVEVSIFSWAAVRVGLNLIKKEDISPYNGTMGGQVKYLKCTM